MKKTNFEIENTPQETTSVSSEALTFKRITANAPACKKCCVACNGCQLRYFNTINQGQSS